MTLIVIVVSVFVLFALTTLFRCIHGGNRVATQTRLLEPVSEHDAIAVRDLVLQFGTRRVLDGVTFRVVAGSRHCIVGENGSGKTSLVNVLATLLRRFRGDLTVLGAMAGPDVNDSRLCGVRRRIGLLWQQALVELEGTCLENVDTMAAIRGVPKRLRPTEVQRVLKLVRLDRRANDRACELNGGDKRLLSLACALAGTSGGILVADEPTANMSRERADYLLTLLKDLNKAEGYTVIVVTHDLDWAKRFGGSLWELRNGRLAPLEAHKVDAEKGRVADQGETSHEPWDDFANQLTQIHKRLDEIPELIAKVSRRVDRLDNRLGHAGRRYVTRLGETNGGKTPGFL